MLGVGGASSSASTSGAGSASGSGASGSATASTGSTPDAASSGAAGSSGAVGTGGAGASSLDPTIVAKLREVRTHLDGFEEASGDPTFVVEKIEKILDQAAGGGASAGGAVGTSGSTGGASAGGSVTLSAAQVQELRRQLETIKAAAKR